MHDGMPTGGAASKTSFIFVTQNANDFTILSVENVYGLDCCEDGTLLPASHSDSEESAELGYFCFL